MYNNSIKKNGITLVALVVTLIILLILTGISIATIGGENGIINRAKQAKIETFKADVKEDIEITLLNIQYKYHSQGKELKLDDITQTILNEENKNISNYGSKNKYQGTYSKNNQNIDFIIKKDFTIGFVKENDISNENNFININTEDENIVKWCKTVNITPIENINDLVNNEMLMNIFMNSKSAVDYMITNNTIMNAIANSEVAMKVVGKNNYVSYTVMKNTEAKNIILGSSYIDEFNNKNIISPNLSGYVENLTYSSCNSDTWAAWKVFDRNEETQWGTNNNQPLPNWIEYNFGKEYLIYKVEIVNAYQSGMGEQSGNVYINDVNVGSYDVKEEKVHYNVDCLTQGSKIKVTCDKYNWQSVQSYLSEIYVYGIEIPDDINIEKGNVTFSISSNDENVTKWSNSLNTSTVNSLNDLVNNEMLMNIFMNSKSAVDYMITNNTIMNAIANSEVAMKVVGKNNYASYTVMKNTEAKNIILGSSYIDEFNNKNIISPKLNGYVENLTYSSCNSDTWAAWKVFDRNEGTQWGTNNNQTLPNWIEYNLGKEYLIYKVEIVNAYQSGMGEQSGNVYINDVNVGNYDVKGEKEHYNVDCLAQGSKIKVTCDKYNWQSVQSYLSEIYVYGIEVPN